MDTGHLLSRLVVGLLLVGPGAQKRFGWFGGYGLAGTGGYLAGLGYRPRVLFALLAGRGEAVGGVLIALGLGTPVGGAPTVAAMVNASSGHAGKGLWNSDGGWELPLLYVLVGAALAFTGAGGLSLDAALGWDLDGTRWGLGATAAGIALGLLTQPTRRRDAAAAVNQEGAAMT